MTYETGKDMKTSKDRLKKIKGSASSSNLLGKMANAKLSSAKHKALEKIRGKK